MVEDYCRGTAAVIRLTAAPRRRGGDGQTELSHLTSLGLSCLSLYTDLPTIVVARLKWFSLSFTNNFSGFCDILPVVWQ